MAKKKSNWEKWRNKKAKQAMRRIHSAYLIVVSVALIVGIAAGAFFANHLTRNDRFVLNGEKYTVVTVGSTLSYVDEGVTCISMGRALASEDIEIITDMTVADDGKTFTGNTDEEGEYHIEYKIKSGRYAGLSRIRVFTVVADTSAGV